MSNTTDLMARGCPAALATTLTDIFAESGSANTWTGTQTFATGVTLATSAPLTIGTSGTLVFGAGATLDADSGTVTLSTNAGTLSKMAGKITTEALTTAAGSGQDLTITNTLCAATSLLLVTRTGGTSTGGTPIIKAVPGSGSFVITLDNKHASAAFDGTFIFSYLLLLA